MALTKVSADLVTGIPEAIDAAIAAAGVVKADGTTAMTGELSLGSNKITNLATPTVGTDAVNKTYADSLVSSPPDLTPYVKKDGTVAMTAALNLGSNKITNVTTPADPADAATKGYADSLVPDLTPYLEKDGSVTMTGALNLGSNKILAVTTPTDPTDGANKSYVDSAVSGGAGANTALSNLTNPTSINQNLLPSDSNKTIGTAGAPFVGMHSNNMVAYQSGSTDNAIAIQRRGVNALVFPHTVDSVVLAGYGLASTSGLPLAIVTQVDPDVDANPTFGISVLTGNKTAGTGASGAITLKTGTSSGGARGKVVLDGLEIDVSSKKITNLATPTAGTDAVTKTYADALVPAYIAPTTQILTASGTYNTPANARYIKIKMVGGGGGGAGSGSAAGTAATAGGASVFGGVLTANGGGFGAFDNPPSAGGTATVTTSATVIKILTAQGNPGGSSASTGASMSIGGGEGGPSPFGGAGAAGDRAAGGGAAVANSGSGGGGGGTGLTSGIVSGTGGSSGGYLEAIIIPTALQSFVYTIGTAGAAGGAGTTGFAGAAGGAGQIIVEEYYS